MKLDRRRALALLGSGAAAAPGGAQAQGAVAFRHGVASGDPTQDRVVIWSRVSPEAPGAEIPFTWTVTPVDRRAGGSRKGQGVTGPGRDYTIKIDVAGLTPGRAYTYQFEAGGVSSPIGRTRTLPDGPTQDVVLAVASCSLYPAGLFNAYRAIANLDRLDAVIHLGDYIYEYGGDGSYGMNSPVAQSRRNDPDREIISLGDYRRRHAQYKSDPDLQAAHARAPWIVTWDDHETTNNSFTLGAENHTAATEGDWATRKAVALKAYFEWMPIRDPAPGVGMAEAAMRGFRFGDLASLLMIETRLAARDRQLTLAEDLVTVDGKPDIAGFRAKLEDPTRRLMSPPQEAWIASEVAASVKAGHAWQVFGNQVVMARLMPFSPSKALTPAEIEATPAARKARFAEQERLAGLGLPTTLDMWDGYPAARERLYATLKAAGARPVVVSGDSHSFWANELHDAEGALLACEFGTTGITSPGAGELYPGLNMGEVIARMNPEVIFNDQVAKGFVKLTLTRTLLRAEMMAVSTIDRPEFETRAVAVFEARPEGTGVSKLKRL
jgi:alkaline phosphatase D